MTIAAGDVKALLKDVEALRERVLSVPSVSFGCTTAGLQLAALEARIPADAGGTGPGTWQTLAAEEQEALTTELSSLRNELEAVTDPSPLMSPKLAPTWMIALLLAVAVLGIGSALGGIVVIWKDAASGPGSPGENQTVLTIVKQQAEEATRERLRLHAELRTKKEQVKTAPPTPAQTPVTGTSSGGSARAASGGTAPAAEGTGGGGAAGVSTPTRTPANGITGGGRADSIAALAADPNKAIAQLEAAAQRAAETEKQIWREAAQVQEKIGPTEMVVIRAVMLFGALGGLLHLASSLTMFVGNRDLKRSWLIYYLMAPLQGAALAPLIYLLLKSAILAPQFSQGTQGLNLSAVYALSGLSGLFAKQAIEKLADLFATFFTKVKADDPTRTSAGGTA